MKRFATAATLGVLAMLILVLPGAAAWRWCITDPIVRLGNDEYQVLVSVPEEFVPQVNGPLYFEIYSPRVFEQELLFVDAGYNGHGETVVFKRHARLHHTFYLKVPNSASDDDDDDDENGFPVLVEIYKNGTLIKSTTGTSDGIWMHVPLF